MIIMEKLRSSPLVYVLTVLEFSPNPHISKLGNEELANLTEKLLEAGYPDRIISKHQLIEFQIGNEEGFSPIVRNPQRLVFRAAGEMSAVHLSENSLALITTNYEKFEDFSTEFSKILNVISDTVKDQNKTVLKKLGLRYINLICPQDQKTLSSYFKDNISPIKLDILGDAKDKYSVSTSSVQLTDADKITIKIEELYAPEGMVHKVIPEELFEPDTKAGLIINGYQYWSNIFSKNYALLDMDQQHTFNGSPLFDIDSVLRRQNELHEYNEKVFLSTISQEAFDEWK